MAGDKIIAGALIERQANEERGDVPYAGIDHSFQQ